MIQILPEQKQSFMIFLPLHILAQISLNQRKYSTNSEELLLILLEVIKPSWFFFTHSGHPTELNSAFAYTGDLQCLLNQWHH